MSGRIGCGVLLVALLQAGQGIVLASLEVGELAPLELGQAARAPLERAGGVGGRPISSGPWRGDLSGWQGRRQLTSRLVCPALAGWRSATC